MMASINSLCRLCVRALLEYTPEQWLYRIAFKQSIDSCLWSLSPFGSSLPNYNTEFHVEGLDPSRVIWLTECPNRQPDDPVILFCHGGAYMMGLFFGFFAFWMVVLRRLNNPRLSILVLDYTLSQDAKFPRQLCEITMVQNELSRSCSNVVLAGDSAGGHLILSMLRHSVVPVDGVPPINTKLENTVTGLILMSPWLNLYPTEAGSYEKYKHIDMLSLNFLKRCTLKLFGGSVDPQLLLNYADASTIPWLPQSILITVGEYELFHDDIIQFYKTANRESSQLFINPKACHDEGFLLPWTSNITSAVVEYLKQLCTV